MPACAVSADLQHTSNPLDMSQGIARCLQICKFSKLCQSSLTSHRLLTHQPGDFMPEALLQLTNCLGDFTERLAGCVQVCQVCEPSGVSAGLLSGWGPPVHLLPGCCHCLHSQADSCSGWSHGLVLWVRPLEPLAQPFAQPLALPHALSLTLPPCPFSQLPILLSEENRSLACAVLCSG